MTSPDELTPMAAQIERAIRRASKGQSIDDTEAQLLAARGGTACAADGGGKRTLEIKGSKRGLGPIITLFPEGVHSPHEVVGTVATTARLLPALRRCVDVVSRCSSSPKRSLSIAQAGAQAGCLEAIVHAR